MEVDPAVRTLLLLDRSGHCRVRTLPCANQEVRREHANGDDLAGDPSGVGALARVRCLPRTYRSPKTGRVLRVRALHRSEPDPKLVAQAVIASVIEQTNDQSSDRADHSLVPTGRIETSAAIRVLRTVLAVTSK